MVPRYLTIILSQKRVMPYKINRGIELLSPIVTAQQVPLGPGGTSQISLLGGQWRCWALRLCARPAVVGGLGVAVTREGCCGHRDARQLVPDLQAFPVCPVGQARKRSISLGPCGRGVQGGRGADIKEDQGAQVRRHPSQGAGRLGWRSGCVTGAGKQGRGTLDCLNGRARRS